MANFVRGRYFPCIFLNNGGGGIRPENVHGKYKFPMKSIFFFFCNPVETCNFHRILDISIFQTLFKVSLKKKKYLGFCFFFDRHFKIRPRDYVVQSLHRYEQIP